jgi:hypothetical protein
MDITTSAVLGGAYRRDTIAAPSGAAPSAVRPELTTAVAAPGRGEKSALDSDRRNPEKSNATGPRRPLRQGRNRRRRLLPR